MTGERRSIHPIDLARKRQAPESYEEELVPQALDLIRTAAHRDDEIHLAIESLDADRQRALKSAENVETFKLALLNAFPDQPTHIIAAALGKLDSAITLLSGGRQGKSLAEKFGNNAEMVLRVLDIDVTARKILRQLGTEIMSETREPLMIAVDAG